MPTFAFVCACFINPLSRSIEQKHFEFFHFACSESRRMTQELVERRMTPCLPLSAFLWILAQGCRGFVIYGNHGGACRLIQSTNLLVPWLCLFDPSFLRIDRVCFDLVPSCVSWAIPRHLGFRRGSRIRYTDRDALYRSPYAPCLAHPFQR